MTRSTLFSIAIIVVAGAVVSPPLCAGAQTKISHSVIAPGGESSAGSLRLFDAVGQPVTGTATTSGIQSHTGYIPIVSRYRYDTPTAVMIASFDAEARRSGVLLRWVIGASDGLSGFNVYRSESREGGFVNIARLSTAVGAEYEDTGVRPGTTYFYRLGAVDNDGEFLSHLLTVTTPVWRTELR
jgi:hypothetical protein